jgi:hypothetical protein
VKTVLACCSSCGCVFAFSMLQLRLANTCSNFERIKGTKGFGKPANGFVAQEMLTVGGTY